MLDLLLVGSWLDLANFPFQIMISELYDIITMETFYDRQVGTIALTLVLYYICFKSLSSPRMT